MFVNVIQCLQQKLTTEDLPVSSRNRASVAMIFRLKPLNRPSVSKELLRKSISEALASKETFVEGELEVLFIKRADDLRDLHSGQVALPGGKLEMGESSMQAAIRETFEEVSIDLTTDFLYIGRTNETNVYKNHATKVLFVTTHGKVY